MEGSGASGWFLAVNADHPSVLIYFKFCDSLVNHPFSRLPQGSEEGMGTSLRRDWKKERKSKGDESKWKRRKEHFS